MLDLDVSVKTKKLKTNDTSNWDKPLSALLSLTAYPPRNVSLLLQNKNTWFSAEAISSGCFDKYTLQKPTFLPYTFQKSSS